MDTVAAKLAIIEKAAEAGVPVISAMGAGNKLDAAAFRVSDIFETRNDPLARVMRRELKKRGIRKLKVVWSDEPPAASAEEKNGEDPDGKRPPGSTAFVPPVAGMILAGEVVKDLTEGYR